MAPWTPVEIAYVVEAIFTSGSPIVTAQRRFGQHFPKREAPSRKVILRAVSNFRETFKYVEYPHSHKLQTKCVPSLWITLYKFNLNNNFL
jgi:hypothetical protein